MRKALGVILTPLVLFLSLSVMAGSIEEFVREAVEDSSRIDAARERDSSRKPAEILAFSEIAPGDSVLEIAPGGGYYTGLLSRVVGADGKVHAVDPERIFEQFPKAREGFPGYMAEDPRDNVDYSVQFLDQISIDGKVDQVWMVLYYHDTIWTGEDRAAMNRAFFEMLEPGGEYIVVDHHGLAGAGASITQELHRMDADTARADLEAAGFILVDESKVLANPDDPRNDSVFSPERRGKTDRFVWKYRKPADG